MVSRVNGGLIKFGFLRNFQNERFITFNSCGFSMINLNINKIFRAIVLFVLAFGITSLVPTQVITMDRYILNILFLSVVTILIIIYFRRDIKDIIERTKKHEFGLLLVSVILHFILSYIILSFFKQSILPFESFGASPLLMNNFFIWVKPFDIFVQQLLIVLLVKKLSECGMSLREITILFVFGFGLIHIPQILKTDLVVGLSYILIAIIFSFIFPRMILRVRNGYLYNYMIHIGFYDLVALLVKVFF
jgi:hypothetical protein